MKKFKKIFVLMLAFAIAISSVSFNTIAIEVNDGTAQEDSDQEFYQIMGKLESLTTDIYYAFGLSMDYRHPPEPGSQDPNWLKIVDFENIQEMCSDASCMVYEYIYNRDRYDGEINVQTATQEYNKLCEIVQEIVVEKSEVEELVAICEQEDNDNGYYDAQFWSEFQSEIAKAKELLADESIVDQRVTDAFYELMYQYNRLCTYNRINRDVNGDGVMSIMDATYVQRYLVGLETINTSQLYVLGGGRPNWSLNSININKATEIQSYCASIQQLINYDTSNLNILLRNLEKTNPESEEFVLDSIIYNKIYYKFELSSGEYF